MTSRPEDTTHERDPGQLAPASDPTTRHAPEGTSTKDAALTEAREVAGQARERAGEVAGTAVQDAKEVAREAKAQARSLFAEVTSEVNHQAAGQTQRAAGGLSSIATELHQMADGGQHGMATSLAREAAYRLEGAAGWLDGRDPGDLLDDVRRYARRNPGTFLLAAAAIGFIGGRLTRGLRDDAHPDTGRTLDRTRYSANRADQPVELRNQATALTANAGGAGTGVAMPPPVEPVANQPVDRGGHPMGPTGQPPLPQPEFPQTGVPTDPDRGRL